METNSFLLPANFARPGAPAPAAIGLILGSSDPLLAPGKMTAHLFLFASQNAFASSSILCSPQNEGWSRITPSMRAEAGGAARKPPYMPAAAMAMLWAMFAPALPPATKTRAGSPWADSHGSAAPETAQLSAVQESS